MAGNVKAGGAYIELFTKDSALIKGLNSASKKLKDFGGSVMGIGAKMTAIGTVAGGALAAAAIRFANAGSAIDDAAQRTGTSAEAFSALAYAAKMAGSDAETLEKSLIKLNSNVADLGAGSASAQKAFGQLGLTINDLKGKSPDEQMALIADRLAAIPDVATRTAVAMDIFGKSGAQLLPMLAGGAAGLAAMREEAEGLGLVMSSEDAQAAAELGDTFDKLLMVLDRVYQKIGAALAPTLTELSDIVIGALIGVGEFIDENRELVLMVAAGVAAFTALGAGLVTAGAVITGVGIALGALATVLTAIGATIGFLLTPVGLLIGGIGALAVAVWQSSDASGKAIQWFADQFGELVTDSQMAFGAIADSLAAGDISGAAELLWQYLGTVWQAGKVLVYDITNELTNSLIDLWFTASTNIITTAINLGGAIGDAFLAAGDFIRSIWTRIFAWLEDKYYVVAGFLKKLVTAFNEWDAVDLETEQSRKVAAAANAAAASSGTDFQTRQAERAQTVAGVESAMQASRDALGNPLQLDTAAARQELDARRAGLRAAAEAVPARERGAGPEKPKLAPPDMEAAKQAAKLTATGTFSAQAVGGIGGPAERTANNTEEMKRTLRRMEDNGMGAFA